MTEKRLITVAGTPMLVEVASTPEDRKKGLQGRKELDTDAMLFRYEEPVTTPFHMENVHMHLTIAFFDRTGRFLGSRELSAGDKTPIFSPGAFLYAIEFPTSKAPALSLGDRIIVPWS